MNKKFYLLTIVLASLVISGCGKSDDDDVVAAAPVGAAPAATCGYQYCGGAGYYGGYGIPPQIIAGGNYKYQIPILASGSYGFTGWYIPVLNTTNPAGGVQTGLYAQASDRIKFSGSGAWDDDTFYLTCGNEFPITGSKGLMISNGVTVQNIASAGTITISQAGPISYGFNANSSATCAHLSINYFYLEHCETPQGQTISCP